MRRQKINRILWLLTAFIVVLSGVLAGCSSGGEGSRDKGSQGGSSGTPLLDREAEQYELPLVTEPFTLVFATADNPDISNSYTRNLPAFQELEKRTGISVKFEVTPADQYNTTMQTRLAAAKDLPDLIRLPDDPIRYAKGGLIIPLDDLIGSYAPSILIFSGKARRCTMTAPDGAIYTLSAVVDARSMVNLNGLGMRKDWLETLNLEEPDTIDQWFDVLMAFKEGDPNGNGKKDEIPVIAINVNGLYKLAWSYGLHLALSDGWYPDEDGKIVRMD